MTSELKPTADHKTSRIPLWAALVAYVFTWMLTFHISKVYLIVPGISFCFLPTAVTFYFVYRFGAGLWAFTILAPFFTGLVNGEAGFWPHFYLDLRHILCFGGAALILRHCVKGRFVLTNVRNTFLFLSLALIAGLFSAAWAQWFSGGSFMDGFLGYWIGDVNGILLLAPMFFLFEHLNKTDTDVHLFLAEKQVDLREVIALCLATIGGIWISFGMPFAFGFDTQLWYMVLLPVVWAALRYGTVGIALALFTASFTVVACLGIYGMHQGILELQVFMLTIATAGHLLAATATERESALKRLRLHEANLQAEVDARTIELQKEIRIRSEAEMNALAASRAKSIFLANMSHEIRTPMNGVLGLTELLRQSELNQNQRHYLDLLHSSGESLMTVLNDILDFSKIEAGELSVTEKPFDPAELVMQVAGLFQETARQKGLKMPIILVPEVPGQVLGDAVRVRQILSNLINNGVKFTEKGEVKITLNALDSGKENVTLIFEVQDTGIGMSEGTVAGLFQPFYQSDGTSSRKHGGTGLGLAISKGLAHLLQGELRVSSELGKGSCFTLALTVKKIPGTMSKSVAVIEGTAKTRVYDQRVLLVEDDNVNAEVMGAMLEVLGIEFDRAHDGSEALSMLLVAKYSLILMDCQMPGMDGFECSRRIKSNICSDLPIVAVSAGVFEEERKHCLDVGMDDFIAKPVQIEELQATLATYLAPAN